MSVSARTYQMLYILRQRTLDDLPTQQDDFAAFIAERRKDTPGVYDKAYISPSAIEDLLHRMALMENLITGDGTYQLTALGSQMADLLVDVDACSTYFIDNYKEVVVRAVLAQRARLGQPPANQREIAAIANISLDSVRRGIQSLSDDGSLVEHHGKVITYALAHAPAVASPAAATTADIPDASLAVDPLKAALAAIDDDNIIITEPFTDEGPDPEDKPYPVGQILGRDRWVVKIEDEDEDYAERNSKRAPDQDLLRDLGLEDTKVWEWEHVPTAIRDGHMLLAESLGMTLTDYFAALLRMNKAKVRDVLFEGYDTHS